MFEFDVFRPVTVNTPANVTTSITTSTFKNESGCRLKTCLKETLKKIDDLEHQVLVCLFRLPRYSWSEGPYGIILYEYYSCYVYTYILHTIIFNINVVAL